VGFVDDFTAARSMEIPDENFAQAGSPAAL